MPRDPPQQRLLLRGTMVIACVCLAAASAGPPVSDLQARRPTCPKSRTVRDVMLERWGSHDLGFSISTVTMEVLDVRSWTPAAKAGLRQGDRIVVINAQWSLADWIPAMKAPRVLLTVVSEPPLVGVWETERGCAYVTKAGATVWTIRFDDPKLGKPREIVPRRSNSAPCLGAEGADFAVPAGFETGWCGGDVLLRWVGGMLEFCFTGERLRGASGGVGRASGEEEEPRGGDDWAVGWSEHDDPCALRLLGHRRRDGAPMFYQTASAGSRVLKLQARDLDFESFATPSLLLHVDVGRTPLSGYSAAFHSMAPSLQLTRPFIKTAEIDLHQARQSQVIRQHTIARPLTAPCLLYLTGAGGLSVFSPPALPPASLPSNFEDVVLDWVEDVSRRECTPLATEVDVAAFFDSNPDRPSLVFDGRWIESSRAGGNAGVFGGAPPVLTDAQLAALLARLPGVPCGVAYTAQAVQAVAWTAGGDAVEVIGGNPAAGGGPGGFCGGGGFLLAVFRNAEFDRSCTVVCPGAPPTLDASAVVLASIDVEDTAQGIETLLNPVLTRPPARIPEHLLPAVVLASPNLAAYTAAPPASFTRYAFAACGEFPLAASNPGPDHRSNAHDEIVLAAFRRSWRLQRSAGPPWVAAAAGAGPTRIKAVYAVDLSLDEGSAVVADLGLGGAACGGPGAPPAGGGRGVSGLGAEKATPEDAEEILADVAGPPPAHHPAAPVSPAGRLTRGFAGADAAEAQPRIRPFALVVDDRHAGGFLYDPDAANPAADLPAAGQTAPAPPSPQSEHPGSDPETERVSAGGTVSSETVSSESHSVAKPTPDLPASGQTAPTPTPPSPQSEKPDSDLPEPVSVCDTVSEIVSSESPDACDSAATPTPDLPASGQTAPTPTPPSPQSENPDSDLPEPGPADDKASSSAADTREGAKQQLAAGGGLEGWLRRYDEGRLRARVFSSARARLGGHELIGEEHASVVASEVPSVIVYAPTGSHLRQTQSWFSHLETELSRVSQLANASSPPTFHAMSTADNDGMVHQDTADPPYLFVSTGAEGHGLYKLKALAGGLVYWECVDRPSDILFADTSGRWLLGTYQSYPYQVGWFTTDGPSPAPHLASVWLRYSRGAWHRSPKVRVVPGLQVVHVHRSNMLLASCPVPTFTRLPSLSKTCAAPEVDTASVFRSALCIARALNAT
ncbi:hypothetical protein DIPPA_29568 [Diplonema papillatum]|nr:hypothetical protein DIPPA_29568 [Diplonema papillatum]